MSDEFIIGIDLGTTSVKVALINKHSFKIHTSPTWSVESKADVISSAEPSGHEQDPDRILAALRDCLSRIPNELLKGVVEIAVSGQMHGVMMWRWEDNMEDSSDLEQPSVVSPLYTWQDGRCSKEFLASLPPTGTHLSLATGFASATLFWLVRHEPGSLEIYDCAGTVHDYLVAMLCRRNRPVMSVHNAASWGYFDTITRTWNLEA